MLGAGEIKRQVNESKLLGASRRGQFKAVKSMIENEGINIDVQSFFTGRTPIILSAINSHEDVVEYLMYKGANLEKKDFFDENLIVYAIKNKLSNKICNSIIEKYSSFEYKDEMGKSILHLSIIHGKKTVFNILMDKKAPVEIYDNDGVSPLMVACELGEYDIVKILLERGARTDVMSEGAHPKTVTDYASKHANILHLLSKYKNN